jgi:electron transport complex protein RnfD
VLLALLPGIAMLLGFFGCGVLVNLLWAAVFALGWEALALKLRRLPLRTHLSDCSALVTAALLAIALPPALPWWLLLLGTGSAVLQARQVYGGLGNNPFNPAMVGYAVLLVSFPEYLSQWQAPAGAGADWQGPLDALLHSLGVAANDGYTGATALAVLKHNRAFTLANLWSGNAQFGDWGARGWEWVNLAFFGGGLFLLHKKVFSWHAPVAMLTALAIAAAMFYDNGSSASGGSPLFHLFSGGAMLAAFFIVTDPVSSATSARGRLLFGAGVGLLIYALRRWSIYPDGIAFAVLLMNFAAPLLDKIVQWHTDRHRGATR